MLAVGDKAPDFSLTASDGLRFSLSDHRGRVIVLYFYPRNGTPGCTAEAQSFRDSFGDMSAQSVLVVGISPDTQGSHQRFKDKHGLPFILLSDPEHEVIKAYGAWGEKRLYGKATMGVKRSTFIIDGDGIVRRVFAKVRPDGHGAEILEALKGL